ncbi:MAG: lipopolysaccharide heptosyltransferase II [Magnetococcales bacterium]|nr:lipopolysaccharide heptosyltransferase II [Magnetococcales bacterium]
MSRNGAILVVGPSWVGDMVLAQPLFKWLRQEEPEVAIDVLAPLWSLPLLTRMEEVRQGIPMPVGHKELGLASRFRLGRTLRGAYRQAIVLPNSLKSALLPFFAAIPKRTGFLGELRWGLLNDIRPLDKQRLPRTVDRFVALGQSIDSRLPDPLPLPHLMASPPAGLALLRHFGLASDHAPLLALCPGAEYGPAKRWPVDSFAALARAKALEGWNVVVLGSGREHALGEGIVAPIAPLGINLTGRISLEQAVDVLAASTAVVTNDSGLMHVAAALNLPGVAIFGSSDPKHTPPLGGRLQVLSLGLECAPCFQRECPKGHCDCLRGITPERVREAL